MRGPGVEVVVHRLSPFRRFLPTIRASLVARTNRALFAIAAIVAIPARVFAGAPAPVGDSLELVSWHEIGSPARSNHAMVWDSRRSRAVMLGGRAFPDRTCGEVWSLESAPHPHWVKLETSNTGPMPLADFAAVYDSLGDRVLVFGGNASDLWALALDGVPAWTRLPADGISDAPSPRANPTMILDARRRLVVFGGQTLDAAPDSDVWVMDLDASARQWIRTHPIGVGPGPRAFHAAAYSPWANSMLVWGGRQMVLPCAGCELDRPLVPRETWELELSEPMSWRLFASGPADDAPPAMAGAALLAEPSGLSAWLVPGDESSLAGAPTIDSAQWRYDWYAHLWMRLTSIEPGPGLRAFAAACLDRSTGTVLLQGGSPQAFGRLVESPRADTWRLPGPGSLGRTPLLPSPSPERALSWDARAYLDDAKHELVLFDAEGVWRNGLTGDATWSVDRSPGAHGPVQHDALSALDSRRRRLLVVGGPEGPADRLWALPLDGVAEWQSFAIPGANPPTLFGSACAYDASRDRLIAFPDRIVFPDTGAFAQAVWSLDLSSPTSAWERLTPAGDAPRPRSHATAAWNAESDEIWFVGGGLDGPGEGESDADAHVLELSPSPRWRSAPDPWSIDEGRGFAGVAIDPTLDRVIVHGGRGFGTFGALSRYHDVRALPLGRAADWIDLDPRLEGPSPTGGSLLFDAAAERMIAWEGIALESMTWALGTPRAFGAAQITATGGTVHLQWSGADPGGYTPRIERTGDGGAHWSSLGTVAPGPDGSLDVLDTQPPPTGRVGYRARIERGDGPLVLGTAWLEGGTSPPLAFALAPPRPNPTRDDVVLELASPVAGTAIVEIFDLSGRRVGATLRRPLPAGRTAFTSPLASGLPPGLYLVRASGPGGSATSRLAVIR